MEISRTSPAQSLEATHLEVFRDIHGMVGTEQEDEDPAPLNLRLVATESEISGQVEETEGIVSGVFHLEDRVASSLC
jgi:hypothetical protein